MESSPLADKLRPQILADYVGQQHLLGVGKPLAQLVRAKTIHSMIMWGPPGTGKTTLAKLLAQNAQSHLISMSAVLAGVKEVRQAVADAKMLRQTGKATVLFVDEVHRFNKAQQDAFLPHVENGTVTFIGATTENPSFEVNAALLSRARVYVLQPLDRSSLTILCKRGADYLGFDIEEGAIEQLVGTADGDARRMLNVLDVAAQFVDSSNDLSDNQSQASISLHSVMAALGDSVRRFDKGGDIFYEQISALHKSIRGSSPDAALYWYCRMLDGGADPRYIGRRLIRLASEDVGNADPRALEMTLAAVHAYERLGSPEGDLALAQAVLYLASVPKSDAAYTAFSAAMAFVKETPSYGVPMHIRNAPTAMMKNMGYGAGYRHAHAQTTDEGAYAAGENYFPEEMQAEEFYQPTEQGLEAKIKTRLAKLKTLDRQSQDSKRQS